MSADRTSAAPTDDDALRREIIDVACTMDDEGFAPNKSGNVSARTARGFAITPSALPYRSLQPPDLAELALDGTPILAPRRPSSEWRMHAAIYAARPDAQAIVHTHSPRATALSCTRRGLPAFHYMIALAGGDVRCAPYATFGSDELARHAVEGLDGRRATLLANHGVIALGGTLTAALAVAREVENMAGQYLALLAAGLEPAVLDDAELARVVAKFRDYGRPA
jgi:L-fuculose-phosphate aldolase